MNANVTELDFKKHQPRSSVIQMKVTKEEAERLDKFVEFCRSTGASRATRSSTLRALMLNGLEVFEEEASHTAEG